MLQKRDNSLCFVHSKKKTMIDVAAVIKKHIQHAKFSVHFLFSLFFQPILLCKKDHDVTRIINKIYIIINYLINFNEEFSNAELGIVIISSKAPL